MKEKKQVMDDEKIKQDWELLDNADIDEVCNLLRLHEIRIQDYLIDCVAALCDVDKFDMMINTSKMNTVHARWLFWYSYRYMSNDSFAHIAEITKRYGKRFTEQSISNSVNKMGSMIAKETVWTKRWVLIKRIIKLRTTNDKYNNEKVITVLVQHPKDVEVKFKVINDKQ